MGLMVCALGLAGACRADPPTNAPPDTASDSPSVTVIAPERIASLTGPSEHPITLLHLWATWCGPCRVEFPEVVKIEKNYTDRGLRIIWLSADPERNLDAVRRFLSDHGATSPGYIVSPLNNRVMEALPESWSGAVPASFFFDEKGKLLTSWEGAHSYEDYVEVVEPYTTKGSER